MASTRLKGTKLSLEIDGIEYKGDLTSYEISAEDGDADVITFQDAEEGNTSEFLMALGFVQSTDPESLHQKFWDSSGRTGVPYVLAPHGNDVPSTSQPHLKGTLTIPNPPTLGGEAGPGTFTSSATCKLDGKPEKVTEGTGI